MHNTEGTNPVQAIRDRLDGGRKWLQGSVGRYTDDAAPVCLIGAAAVTATNPTRMEAIDALAQVIVEQYRDRVDPNSLPSPTSCVIQFNDHKLTEWSDVDVVTEKAALLVAERVEL